MKTQTLALCSALLMCVGLSAQAGEPVNSDQVNQDGMHDAPCLTRDANAMNHGMMGKAPMDMGSMDANDDGMMSEQEFMSHHQEMFDDMAKNDQGMVDLSTLGVMDGSMKPSR